MVKRYVFSPCNISRLIEKVVKNKLKKWKQI